MIAQNNTMHLWYSKSHSACEWTGASGVVWAPGGDVVFSTSKDRGKTMNVTVTILLRARACCLSAAQELTDLSSLVCITSQLLARIQHFLTYAPIC